MRALTMVFVNFAGNGTIVNQAVLPGYSSAKTCTDAGEARRTRYNGRGGVEARFSCMKVQ